MLVACPLISAEPSRFVGIIDKMEKTAPDAAQKMGVQKLSAEERAELEKLFAAIYALGVKEGAIPQREYSKEITNQPLPTTAPTVPGNGMAMPETAAWLSRSDINDNVVQLKNGAVFRITSGFGGIGMGRECLLLKSGSRWTLWIEGKREFTGELLSPPIRAGVGFLRVVVRTVSPDGELITLATGEVLRVDLLGRIYSMLWLPGSDAVVLATGEMVNLSAISGEKVNISLVGK